MGFLIRLRILLTIQIIAYIVAMLIAYDQRDTLLDGTITIVPLGIFWLLCYVNVVLFLIYMYRIFKKTMAPDVVTLVLVGVVFLLAVTAPYTYMWADGSYSYEPPK
jgi:hypothetical protein